ncbi:hypothetical protein C8Q73DRAFT_166287 [Cubamyces lactineus]|nr:hypothetical protein C8Q73DRAFT_166287 [Cubamyces lactineus]
MNPLKADTDVHEVTPGLDKLCGLSALPPELVDLVFEHTLYDKDSIRACTLVSRSWRAVSAPFLFSSLTVMRETSFDDFHDFLVTRPDIASCIRELELTQVPNGLDIGSPHAAVTPTALAALSANLPALRVLRLHRMWITEPLHGLSTPTNPVASRSRLKALTLHDCSNDSNSLMSLRTLHAVLASFPSESVSLYWLTIVDASDLSAGCRGSQLHIENLTLYHIHAPTPLFQYFRQILVPHCLRSLQARMENAFNRDPDFLRVLSEFLIHVGGDQLRHLELPFVVGSVFAPEEDDPDHWRILQLQTCSELESVTFHLHVPLRRSFTRTPRTVTSRHGVPISALLVAFLPHLPSSLRVYTLTSLDAYSLDHVQSKTILHLERLDDALVARFPMLAKVRIILRDSDWLAEYFQAILQVMPMCRQRGILDIVVCSEEQVSGV